LSRKAPACDALIKVAAAVARGLLLFAVLHVAALNIFIINKFIKRR
jgi:hypothetical protein